LNRYFFYLILWETMNEIFVKFSQALAPDCYLLFIASHFGNKLL